MSISTRITPQGFDKILVIKSPTADHPPGMDDRTMAKPELMTSASRRNEPVDWAITRVLFAQASSRKSADRERIAMRATR